MRHLLIPGFAMLLSATGFAQPAARTTMADLSRQEVVQAIKVSETEAAPPTAVAVLSAAQKVASKENKKVLVLFHASWCGWCKKMEKAMNEPGLKEAFEKSFVIRWLTVYESGDKKGEENPGAEDLLKQYKGNDLGIPYFLIFDAKGNMLADSQKSPGENIGCPAEPDEVAYFLTVLKKTARLTDAELRLVSERFKKNKG